MIAVAWAIQSVLWMTGAAVDRTAAIVAGISAAFLFACFVIAGVQSLGRDADR